MWAGIVEDELIVLHFLGYVNIHLQNSMRFMHDGAPVHSSRNVNNLNKTFSEQWIGRADLVLWPPRSTELNVLDFYLWVAMTDIVYLYAVEIRNIQDVEGRIKETANINRQSNFTRK